MKRRNFIKNSSLGLGLMSNMNIGKMNLNSFQVGTGPNENDNILIIIQMFGGNDGMNTITPYEWDSYYTLYRPTINVPANTVTPISKEKGMAMHPGLTKGVKNGMLGMFNDGKLAIINGIGYSNPNYSHFRSTDIWLSGIAPSYDSVPLRSGWLGRYFDKNANDSKPESPYCIQIGQNPSLMFMGANTEKSIVLDNVDEMFKQGQDVQYEKINVSGSTNFMTEFSYLNDLGTSVNNYSKVIKKAFDNGKNIESYSDNDLSNQLKLVARLINGGLKSKVYFVEMHGFDTHSNQGSRDGIHAKLLSELSQGISSFQSDIDQLGHADKVVGITTSEFGRRPYENGSQGTDHGATNLMFAFGNSVKGELIGDHFSFLPFRDAQNLNYSTDFRSIYYETMVTWFGQDPSVAETVLGSKFAYVESKGYLKTTKEDKTLPPPPKIEVIDNTSYIDPKSITEQDKFVLSPNPVFGDSAFLAMTLYFGGLVTITLYDSLGRDFGVIHKKNYRAGIQNAFLDFKNISSGLYVLHVQVNNRTHAVKALKI